MVSLEDIKSLRGMTGVSFGQCKSALEAANGDLQAAVVILEKESAKIAAKKGERSLGSGFVAAYIHQGGSVGTLVHLACETDFVAKNPEFISLANDIALHVAGLSPDYISGENLPKELFDRLEEIFSREVEMLEKPAEIKENIKAGKFSAYHKEHALLSQPFIKDENQTIGQIINTMIQKFGERIEVVNFSRYSIR